MKISDFASVNMLGGYSALDGTVEFYGRINAFLKPEFVVVDLGAGRGAWCTDDRSPYQRSLRMLRGKVAKVIGLDVDAAVLDNRSTDENAVLDGSGLPLCNDSIDVIVADYVLEHVSDVAAVEREAFRVLKPGGLFCARTPHVLHYASLGARLAGRLNQKSWVGSLQPERSAADVFPVHYKCNTLRRLNATWTPERWEDYSYLYTAEPSYHFGSELVYRALEVLHKVLPLPFVGNIFAFKVKVAHPRS